MQTAPDPSHDMQILTAMLNHSVTMLADLSTTADSAADQFDTFVLGVQQLERTIFWLGLVQCIAATTLLLVVCAGVCRLHMVLPRDSTADLVVA